MDLGKWMISVLVLSMSGACGNKEAKTEEGAAAPTAAQGDKSVPPPDESTHDGASSPRPRGGQPDEELAERGNAKVTATWTATLGEPPAFAVENQSGRPLVLEQLNLRFVDAGGKVLQKAAVPATLALAAGATQSMTVAFPAAQIPAATKSIEASVARFVFADGAKERWENKN